MGGGAGRKPKQRLPYAQEYDRLLELVVPHMLHPDLFPAPQLTHEELAVLWSGGDESKVVSKMAVCKFEQRTLAKMRAELAKRMPDVKSVGDVFDVDRGRETARKWTGKSSEE